MALGRPDYFGCYQKFNVITLASNGFVYTKPILRCKMLVGNTQALELHRVDAGFAFCKTLFQHSAGVRSHHDTVMITGLGITPNK